MRAELWLKMCVYFLILELFLFDEDAVEVSDRGDTSPDEEPINENG